VLQALQFAASGNAEAAIVAASLAQSNPGGTLPVDPALHDKLEQALVVCGSGPGAERARALAAFIASAKGREVLLRSGFLVP
jgi:molybdate transport system substrate-binding protein